jgi:purine-binding chemotaxis protein CheW
MSAVAIQYRPRVSLNPVREFLSFSLGGAEYGVELVKVQEVRCYESATSLANMPAEFRGVISLGGATVPIVDLRVQLGLKPVYSALSLIIVMNAGGRPVGVVVDAVSEVLVLDSEQIKPLPSVGDRDRGFLQGIAMVGPRMLGLLNMDRLVDAALNMDGPEIAKAA